MSYVYHSGLGATTIAPNLAARFTIPTQFSAARLAKGKNYLFQQNTILGDFVKNNLRRTPTTAKIVSGNKVKADVTSPWAQWNANGAAMLAPVKNVILNIPVLPKPFLEKIVSRPLDALIDLLDPILNRLEKAEKRVLDKHLNGGRHVEFFGKYYDLRLSQEIDSYMDASTLNITKTLRVIGNFFVLWWKKPLELIAECFAEGVDLAKDVAKNVGEAVTTTLISTGKAVSDAVEEGVDAAAGVASTVMGWLGLGITGVDDAAAAGGASATATVAAPSVGQILLSVLGSVVGSVATVVVAMETTKQEQEKTKQAEAAAAAAASTSAGQMSLAKSQSDVAKSQEFPIVPVTIAGVASLALLLYFSRKKA